MIDLVVVPPRLPEKRYCLRFLKTGALAKKSPGVLNTTMQGEDTTLGSRGRVTKTIPKALTRSPRKKKEEVVRGSRGKEGPDQIKRKNKNKNNINNARDI